jgi:hypothetical protein
MLLEGIGHDARHARLGGYAAFHEVLRNGFGVSLGKTISVIDVINQHKYFQAQLKRTQ